MNVNVNALPTPLITYEGQSSNIVGWAERSEAQHRRWVALRLTQPTKSYLIPAKLMR